MAEERKIVLEEDGELEGLSEIVGVMTGGEAELSGKQIKEQWGLIEEDKQSSKESS